MIRNIFFVIVFCGLTQVLPVVMIHRPRRNADSCGVPKIPMGLIVQGQNFTRGSFPWIVALLHTGWTPPKFFCAGTLISKTFVLSAAHCIHQKQKPEAFLPRDIFALFGAHDLENYFETGRFVLSPEKIHLHDDYNPYTTQYDADLSLLKFGDDSIHHNDFVQPICMWNLEDEPPVTMGVVAGWGKSENRTKPHEDIPKMTVVPIWSIEDCLPGEPELSRLSSKRTFCAGLRNGTGVCQGDSGGGLVIEVDGVHYLKGIVSSSLISSSGCDVWKNAIYTNVLKFKDWIEDKMPTAAKKVFCFFSFDFSSNYERHLPTCKINQTINKEQFLIGSPKNTSIEGFDASETRRFKFVPQGIGEKFPNLKEFHAHECGLTIVRDFYFKNMGKLEYLYLGDNRIKTIEPKAFDDLVSLSLLDLFRTRIETLDEKLFVNLINLREIYLQENKIKSLSPTILNIPGNGKLWHVRLSGNTCINKNYGGYYSSPLNQLESDLRTNCSL